MELGENLHEEVLKGVDLRMADKPLYTTHGGSHQEEVAKTKLPYNASKGEQGHGGNHDMTSASFSMICGPVARVAGYVF